MKHILLFKANDCWVAEETLNGEPCPVLLGLFGTNVLPTAFTSSAEASDVLKEMKRLNPEAEVILK